MLVVETYLKEIFEEQGCGCVQQRRYRWQNRRKLVIVDCYLLLHQLHRRFISHWVIISNFLTSNKRTISISCIWSNRLFPGRFFDGQAKHVAKNEGVTILIVYNYHLSTTEIQGIEQLI
jgi:hypothetical protein